MTNNLDNMDAIRTEEPVLSSAPPAGSAAPADFAAPAKKEPRYVGRITLGVTLIFVGIVITLSLFLPGHRLFFLVKLLPLILVALGAEVLISAAIYKDRSVKVGFGLTLLSLFLIAGSVCTAILPSLWEHYGPSYWEHRSAAEQELKDSIYATLDRSLLDDVMVSVQPLGFSGDTLNIVHIELLGDYEDEAAFTNTTAPMVQALAGMDIENLYLSASNDTDQWSLDLDRVFIQRDTSAQELLPRVEHTISYMDSNGTMDSMPASHYQEMVDKGLLVSADQVDAARQEGWDEGYQQGMDDLQSEYDAQDAA